MKNPANEDDFLDLEFQNDYCVSEVPNEFIYSDFAPYEIDWKDFKCDLCNQYLSSSITTKAHIKRHENDIIYECDDCDFKTVIEDEYFYHKFNHIEEKYFRCMYCFCELSDPRKLLDHECTVFSDCCLKCGSRIYNLKETIYHLKKCYTVIKCYSCKFCKYKTKQFMSLIYHTDKHKKFIEFQCLICKNKILTRDKLTAHEARAHKQLFHCQLCGDQFSTEKKLSKHNCQKKKKKPVTIHKCKYCDYKSKNKAHVKIHEMRHEGIKPYKCEICNYRAVIKTDVKIHEMRHEGIKAYKCEICNYRAVIKTDVKIHERNMHSI